jgi:hypothetical protein
LSLGLSKRKSSATADKTTKQARVSDLTIYFSAFFEKIYPKGKVNEFENVPFNKLDSEFQKILKKEFLEY